VTTIEESHAAPRHHPLARRRRRRAIYSLIAVGIVLAVGTAGFFVLTGTSWVDSFYFECMLATGQGPPFPLTSDGAKLFASFMAFLSIGTVITSVILNLGPILAQLWREGIEEAEWTFRRVEEEVADEFRGRNRRP
jgi:hypothetical protein